MDGLEGEPRDGVWSIAAVSRWAGVSSRTLRHYGVLGLLRPAFVAAGGVRHYGYEELLTLQEILVLRALGLPLASIGAVLAGDRDRVDVLREHHRGLLAERDRLAGVATTVARTIEGLERGRTMQPSELFEGFDPIRQERYEAELVSRHGDEVRERIEESRGRVRAMDRAGADAVAAEAAELERSFATLIEAGVAADGAVAQQLTARHYAWVSRFWEPDADAYAGLGDLYVDHPDFRARYDAVHPQLAEYLRASLVHYAITVLS